MTHNSGRHMVFVYGSLKAGFGNHHLLEGRGDVGIIGDAVTVTPQWWMLSLRAYPGVVKLPPSYLTKHHGYNIIGELYEVSDTVLGDLDTLEGNGSFYRRELVELDIGEEETVQAWMYVLISSYSIRAGLLRLENETCTRVDVDEEHREMEWLPEVAGASPGWQPDF